MCRPHKHIARAFGDAERRSKLRLRWFCTTSQALGRQASGDCCKRCPSVSAEPRCPLAGAGDAARPAETGVINQAAGHFLEELIEGQGGDRIVGLDAVMDRFAVLDGSGIPCGCVARPRRRCTPPCTPPASARLQLARRLGVDEKEVRRLPDPHHGPRLPRIAEAVQAPGKRLVVGLA